MQTDFAIVGGGIAGASVAYHLSERTDRPITVFERNADVATGKTAASNAVFRLTGSPAERALKRYGLVQYNDFLADPVADHEARTLYERYDRVEVATTADGAARLADRAEGGPGAYLSPEAVKATVLVPMLETGDVEGALRYTDAVRLDPRALAVEFAARARANDVTFRTGTAVTDVRTTNGRVTGVETDAGRVDADVVVSAAGASNVDVAELAGVDLPQRHDVAVLRRVRPHARFPSSVPNLKHAETGVFYTGRADGSVVVGRSGGGYDDCTRRRTDSIPDDVPSDVETRIETTAETLVPALATDRVDVEAEWVGRSCKTPDGHPIVGRTGREGFAVAAFHSEGIQLAPAAGRLLADALLDGGSDLPATEVSPHRFATDG